MSLDFRKMDSDEDLEQCVEVIRNSFATVAQEFHLTRENAPGNGAFMEFSDFQKYDREKTTFYGAFEENRQVGFFALLARTPQLYYLERLAVLPEFRHRGFGEKMLNYAAEQVRKAGGERISIGIINDNSVLKNWYDTHGFVETGRKTFPQLFFEVCYMELVV